MSSYRIQSPLMFTSKSVEYKKKCHNLQKYSISRGGIKNKKIRLNVYAKHAKITQKYQRKICVNKTLQKNPEIFINS